MDNFLQVIQNFFDSNGITSGEEELYLRNNEKEGLQPLS
jgi:hypothetical protein